MTNSAATEVIDPAVIARAKKAARGADTGIREDSGEIVLDDGIRHRLRAKTSLKAMLLGGAPLDGPRHLWWNFVSSSRDRIEQAKEDWRNGAFGIIDGETEFIPLPER